MALKKKQMWVDPGFWKFMKKKAVDKDKNVIEYSKELYENWKKESDEIQKKRKKEKFSFF